MAEYSPMMKHYIKTKEAHSDCILFYRLGDFYEMFFDDAITASKELELTLTGKQCGMDERAPMCGVPFHAADTYINRLVSKGYKVAICEQMEDPKQAKGIVERQVIRIVTPGTNTDALSLDETKNNYLMCIYYDENVFGVSTADVSTGDFFVTEIDTVQKLVDEINKFAPAEIICNEALFMSALNIEDLRSRLRITVTALDSWYFTDDIAKNTLLEHFHVRQLDGLGLVDYLSGTLASGALLKYLYETQMNGLDHMTSIHPYATGTFMVLDSATRRNLELVETMREKNKKGSLLWVLDKT
ncbi:MAG: DNA mismatch repair protein MutS, partial [bacterium]|nr:DNA mismatch repair protein MutS [bacterium]MDY4098913.1 DNA mismatch repair protein MutS [Lachnospiraceae bacterium]